MGECEKKDMDYVDSPWIQEYRVGHPSSEIVVRRASQAQTRYVLLAQGDDVGATVENEDINLQQ